MWVNEAAVQIAACWLRKVIEAHAGPSRRGFREPTQLRKRSLLRNARFPVHASLVR